MLEGIALVIVVAVNAFLVYLHVRRPPAKTEHHFTLTLPDTIKIVVADKTGRRGFRDKLDNLDENEQVFNLRDRWLDKVMLLPPEHRAKFIDEDEDHARIYGRPRRYTQKHLEELDELLTTVGGTVPPGMRVGR